MNSKRANATVLIADDSAVMRTLISHVIKRLGYKHITADDGNACIRLLQDNKVDLLLLDINMPGKNGIDVLAYMKENGLEIPVIMITASDDISQAVQCIKMGAYEYLTKPVDNDRLEITAKNALSEQSLKKKVELLEKELLQKDIFKRIYGESQAIKECIGQATQVMETDVNVLINGESGTGKELFAQAIHNGSKRKNGPFVTINCAAITNELADSLLFGHVKGSFTGANSDHTGFFEQADGGTIFLDEIGDLNIEIQAKVLRVLQEHIVRRVGEKKERPVDFRLISATHKDFSNAIETGSFRADLYYRLEEYPLYIPPLRERGDDISLLAKHFLESFCIANNIEPLTFKPLVLDQLSRYDWPGNIRELQNIVRRSAINRTGNEINALPGFLSADHKRPKDALPEPEASHPEPVTDTEINHPIPAPVETSLKDAEQQAIARAYEACRGNQTKTARILGISRSSLYRKLKKYGMEKSITLSLNKTP